MDTTSGWFPVGALAGTVTFTWYRPTEPGVSPLNATGAAAPPIVTCGVAVVVDGVAGLGSPEAG